MCQIWKFACSLYLISPTFRAQWPGRRMSRVIISHSILWAITSTPGCMLRHTLTKSFSSPITGVNERLWQQKKWKDKGGMKEERLESKGYRRKSEPTIWNRRDNKRHVAISLSFDFDNSIPFYEKSVFFVRSGREFWRGEKSFWVKEKEGKSRLVENFSHSYHPYTQVVSKIPRLHSPPAFPSCMSQSFMQTTSCHTSRWQQWEYSKWCACVMAAIDQTFQLSCMSPNFVSYTQCYECEALNYENLVLQTSVMFSCAETF